MTWGLVGAVALLFVLVLVLFVKFGYQSELRVGRILLQPSRYSDNAITLSMAAKTDAAPKLQLQQVVGGKDTEAVELYPTGSAQFTSKSAFGQKWGLTEMSGSSLGVSGSVVVQDHLVFADAIKDGNHNSAIIANGSGMQQFMNDLHSFSGEVTNYNQ